MAKKELGVGVKIDGDAKGFKSAAEDAKKATAALKKKTAQDSREMERQFKQVTMSLAKIAAAVLVAKKGFEMYGKVIDSTNATGDKFAIQQEKIRAVSTALSRAIATTDFSDFASKMKDAAKQGENLAKQLDLIFDIQLRLKLIESGANLAMVRQELVFRNTSNPWQVRVAAAEEYLKIVKELETEQMYVAEQEAKAAMLQSGVVASGIDEQRLRYLVESAKVIDAMSQDIQDYVNATSARGEAVLFGGAGGESPKTIKRWVEIRRSASDAVKDFAKDFQQYALVTDPERLKLTEAWENYDKVMTEAGRNAMKPLRSVSSLLGKQEETLTRISAIVGAASGSPSLDMSGKKQNIYEGPLFGNTAAIPDMTNQMNQSIAMVNELNSAFEGMFSSVEEGFKGMADAMLQSLKRLVVELLAKSAVLTLLNIIAPGSGMAVGAGSSFLKQYGFLPNMLGKGGGGAKIGAATQNINITGKIAGRDINLVNSRYNNLLTSST